MQYAMHESEDESGRLFDATRGCELFTQQLVSLHGEHEPADGDEVLYVLEGSAEAQIDGHDHRLAPGTAVFVARGTSWSVDGEARDEHHRNRVEHAPPEAGRRSLVAEGAHRQRVEADDPSASAHHVGGGGPRTGGHACRAAQPLVELGNAGVELVEFVGVKERLDGP